MIYHNNSILFSRNRQFHNDNNNNNKNNNINSNRNNNHNNKMLLMKINSPLMNRKLQ